MVIATLKSLVKVNSDNDYNAFTDLIHFNGKYWVSYRSGKGHVSPHGHIVISNSEDGISWSEITRIHHESLDIRDPHFEIIEGKLTVVVFALDYFNKPSTEKYSKADSLFYQMSEDEPYKFSLVGTFSYEKNKALLWWIREYDGYIYVNGYDNGKNNSYLWLFRSKLIQGPWERICQIPDTKNPANVSYNEANGIFEVDGTLTLFCRTGKISKIDKRELKERKATHPGRLAKRHFELTVVARAKPPYTDWKLEPHKIFLQGPCAIPFNDSYLFVGRFKTKRSSYKQKEINLYLYADGKFSLLLTLATGRDGSYAGMCWNPKDPKELLISFYSDHARMKTSYIHKANDVWVARVNIES